MFHKITGTKTDFLIQGCYGTARTRGHGDPRHGTAVHGTAIHGTARHGNPRHGTARHGAPTARHGMAHGTARHGAPTARHGMARHGRARPTAQHVPWEFPWDVPHLNRHFQS